MTDPVSPVAVAQTLFERFDSLGRCYARAELSKEHVLVARWDGFATADMIQEVLLEILRVGPTLGVVCVLHDNRRALGSWDHLVPWILNEYQPAVVRSIPVGHAANLIASAGLTSHSSLLLSRLIPQPRLYRFRLFYNEERAINWLLSLPLK